MSKRKSLHTAVAHDEHDQRHYGAVTVPVYANTLFTFENYEEMDRDEPGIKYSYSRGDNPTVNALEQRLAELEGGAKARCFASGMGAISAAVLSLVRTGEHIVCVDQAYGPAREFMGRYLERFGIATTFVDGTELGAIEDAVRENTSLLYLESPTSLFFQLQDVQACAALARKRGLRTVIDNTWATPCFQQPLALGIDLVVHSLTKYIGGHSDALGGVVIGSAELVDAVSGSEHALLGAVMQPQAAATLLRGLRTLPLRMERHQASAGIIARHLESLRCVDRVHYPGLTSHPQHELAQRQLSGFSSVLSFEAGTDIARLKRFADGLRLFRIGFSWGGYESLVSIQTGRRTPASEPVPVARLYVGLEDPEDLVRDLDAALRQAGFDLGGGT